MRARPSIPVAAAGVLLLVPLACSSIDPVAPANTTLTLEVNPTTLLPGEQAAVRASLRRSDGRPVINGTTVFFSATEGSIPASGETEDSSVTVTYAAPETFAGDVQLVARSGVDDSGGQIRAEVTVTVVDTRPTVSDVVLTADPPELPRGGGLTTLTAAVFDDQGVGVPGVEVIFRSDAGELARSTADPVTNSRGRARARLRTTRDTVASATVAGVSDEITVSVETISPPEARITVSNTNPEVGETVTYSGSGSTDDGAIVRYSWDLGNGVTAGGANVSTSYSTPGSYLVTLTVRDDDGEAGVATQTVTVTADAPVASFTFTPGSPTVGKSVAFDASSSLSDTPIVQYAWNWGDGTSPTVSGSPRVSHVFAAAGTYQVSLTITTADDQTDVVTVQVTVNAS